MAQAVKPTNEQIVRLLDQLLVELRELRRDHDALSADIGKLAATIER